MLFEGTTLSFTKPLFYETLFFLSPRVILLFTCDSRCGTLRHSGLLLISALAPEPASRLHGPGWDPEGLRPLQPPAAAPSDGRQDGQRRATAGSVLEPAGDFCFLEPFSHRRGLPDHPAALGGDSAPPLGLNPQPQLHLGPRPSGFHPNLLLRALTRRGRQTTDLEQTEQGWQQALNQLQINQSVTGFGRNSSQFIEVTSRDRLRLPPR